MPLDANPAYAMDPRTFRLVRRFAAVHGAIALLSLAAWGAAFNAWLDSESPMWRFGTKSARGHAMECAGEGFLLATAASEAASCLLWRRSPALAPRACPRPMPWGNAILATSLVYALWLGPKSGLLASGLDALAAGVADVAALCFVASLPAVPWRQEAADEPAERDSLFSTAKWLARVQTALAWLLACGAVAAEFA